MYTQNAKSKLDIRGLSKEYLLGKGNKTHRYESFDLSNHRFRTRFRDSNNKIIDRKKNCAILSAFLAGWGMMRTSSFLIKHNDRIIRPVIDHVSGLDSSCWEIDVEHCQDSHDKILEIYRENKEKLVPEKFYAKTLVTEKMLDMFAMFPAFDENCTTFMRAQPAGTCKSRSFNRDALGCIYPFYEKYTDLVEECKRDAGIRLVDYDGNRTTPVYFTAKIVDVIGSFCDGEILKNRKKYNKRRKKQLKHWEGQ